MALDAAIYPQDSFGYLYKELYALNGVTNGYGFGFSQEEKGFVEMLDGCMETNLQPNWDSSSTIDQKWDPKSSPEACMVDGDQSKAVVEVPASVAAGKRKRRRTRSCKNKEELENQRMTHIAVERNRRRQMNDYLSVIRTLMPASYVQRGDQASIIGGAINYVKELEQHLQALESQKRNPNASPTEHTQDGVLPPLFGDFFSFPQYSTARSSHQSDVDSSSSASAATNAEASADQKPAAAADIEVSMADSHANLKILSKRRPRQLLKLVAGLQCLWFTILHLNVTTVDQMVLYSISIKLEDGCQLTSVDEIADAVNHLLSRIEEETAALS